MNSWRCLLVCLLLTPCLGQAPKFRATLADVSTTQCRMGRTDSYDLYLSTHFLIENMSDSSILVARHLNVVPGLRVASSQEKARKGEFSLIRSDEYAYKDGRIAEPTLDDFMIVKAGEKRVIAFDAVEISASAKEVKTGSLQLQEGKYWIQFGFSFLPEYFRWMHEDVPRFREKWKSVGQLPDELIWSEPFPFEVKLIPRAEECSPR